MKLEYGGFYKTRDGRTVGPLEPSEYPVVDSYPFKGVLAGRVAYWTNDGRFYHLEASAEDIVEKLHQTWPNDAEVVERFNELVAAGKVQFCIDRDNTKMNAAWADQDAVQRLKPLPRSVVVVLEGPSELIETLRFKDDGVLIPAGFDFSRLTIKRADV